MHFKKRLKLLQRLAQNNTTLNNPPTINGSPAPFDVDTYFPSVRKGWGNVNIVWIQNILNALNWTVYVLSAQQFDLNKFRQSYFIPTVTNIPDKTLLPIVRFSTLVYNKLLTPTGGSSQFNEELDDQEKQKRKSTLLQAITSPMTLIPDGAINVNLQGKIGGNLKEVLTNAITQLK